MTPPVFVVTGFLGAGKTTLIARLLRDPAYAGSAVIINEFGEVGLDHHLVAASDPVLLPAGCLCCAVRGDLVRTLDDLAQRRAAGSITYDRVIIETTGLADPAPILHALMTEGHEVGALLTLVDGVLGEDTLTRYPEAQRQVAFADRLLVTKVPSDAALLAALRGINPDAAFVADADRALLHVADRAPSLPTEPLPRHTGGVGSTIVRRIKPVPAVALTLWLQAMTEHCGTRLLRMKGLVDVREMPGQPALIQGVQHVIAPPAWQDCWPDDDHSTRLVVIGEGIPPFFPARLLDAIAAEAAELVAS